MICKAFNWICSCKTHILMILFYSWQFVYFCCVFENYRNDSSLSQFRSVMRLGLPFARAAAFVLNSLCAVVLLTVCRYLITKIKQSCIRHIIDVNRIFTLVRWSNLDAHMDSQINRILVICSCNCSIHQLPKHCYATGNQPCTTFIWYAHWGYRPDFMPVFVSHGHKLIYCNKT